MKMNEQTDLIYDNDQGEGVHRIDAGSRGTIVNMASVSSFIAQPEFLPYIIIFLSNLYNYIPVFLNIIYPFVIHLLYTFRWHSAND